MRRRDYDARIAEAIDALQGALERETPDAHNLVVHARDLLAALAGVGEVRCDVRVARIEYTIERRGRAERRVVEISAASDALGDAVTKKIETLSARGAFNFATAYEAPR